MHDFWDRLGISASLICVLHCLITPFLVLLMPVVGEFLSNVWFHILIFVIVFPVAAWALWSGYREHHLTRMLWLGGAGLILILVAMIFGGEHSIWEVALMIFAGLLLTSAHLLNLRACRRTHAKLPNSV